MGTTPVIMQGFQTLLLNPERGFRIAKRFGLLYIRARLNCSNKNVREHHTQIPQPHFFNSTADISFLRLIQSNFWLKDMNILHSSNAPFEKLYRNFDYDGITKTFYPTKNNAMELVNMATMWGCSWWNPYNKGRFDLFKKSDVLFADMLVNTQGIYKAKRVVKGNQNYERVKKLFQNHLKNHEDQLGLKGCQQSVVDTLINNNNLYWIDYPEMRRIEDNEEIRRQIGGKKYTVQLTTSTSKQKFKGYSQIPFGIFAKVPNYLPGQENFVCIGACFNESEEVYHPFDKGDQTLRDKWELAKSHFASTDNNDFIIRVHLGFLHYASAIYTTALCNLSKKQAKFGWFKSEFIDKFAYGLLQINFLANLTLVDYKDPIAQKTIYLRAAQSLPLIREQNSKFNILQFTPELFSKDCYESDSTDFSLKYYKKIEFYIEYLFKKHEASWKGKTAQLGTFIYNQLRNGNDKFDGIPESICHDQTPETLKKLLTNLAYLWLIHHGETFSIISVVNMYYFCPTFLRKPLRQFPNQPLTDLQKQQWLAPKEVINDSMILSKQVTFRKDSETIVSQWGRNDIDNRLWNEMRKKDIERRQQNGEQNVPEYQYEDYENYWNDVCVEADHRNSLRSKNGLFYLHWLMPHEMPNALNI